MIVFDPLWAFDVDNIIGIVVVILFIIVPAIGQLLKAAKPKQPPGQGRARAAPRPAAGEIEGEIGDFLRRAAQARPAQGGPRAPRPARPVVPPLVADAVHEQPVEAEIVGEHRRELESTISTDQFDQRTSRLGGEVVREEKQLREQVHGTFDREVSELSKRSSKPTGSRRKSRSKPRQSAALPETAAAGLAALLSNADSIRQAIVVNEILTRPEDRWE